MDPTPTLPRKREDPHDRGQPRTNTYWHPEKLLRPERDDGDKDDDEDDGSDAA
jgi:hypothetical protein